MADSVAAARDGLFFFAKSVRCGGRFFISGRDHTRSQLRWLAAAKYILNYNSNTEGASRIMPHDPDMQGKDSPESSENIQVPPISKPVAGAAAGALIGSIAGPVGAAVGGAIGALAGKTSASGRPVVPTAKKAVKRVLRRVTPRPAKKRSRPKAAKRKPARKAAKSRKRATGARAKRGPARRRRR